MVCKLKGDVGFAGVEASAGHVVVGSPVRRVLLEDMDPHPHPVVVHLITDVRRGDQGEYHRHGWYHHVPGGAFTRWPFAGTHADSGQHNAPDDSGQRDVHAMLVGDGLDGKNARRGRQREKEERGGPGPGPLVPQSVCRQAQRSENAADCRNDPDPGMLNGPLVVEALPHGPEDQPEVMENHLSLRQGIGTRGVGGPCEFLIASGL